MTRGRAWLVAGVVVLGTFAVLIPDGPVYLPNLFIPKGQHDGHPTRHWVRELGNPDVESRRKAVHALGAIGTNAPEAVPALSAVLTDDPDRYVRSEAALALSKMDPASAPAVPALARALADEEPLVRMNCAVALFRLRDEARPAVPALIRALRDKANRTDLHAFPFTIQGMAALALGRASAGTAEGVAALREALGAADTDNLRGSIARALGEVGAEAEPAVPQLRELLTSADGDVRRTAKESLEKIGGKSAALR
jgi:HEAT repeat protein